MNPLTVGDRAIPKALLPIGGGQEVLVDRVLAWIEASGIIGERRAIFLGRSLRS